MRSASSSTRAGASRASTTSRGRSSAASGDVRPVAGGAIVVAGVDRHPKVWPSHIEDRRVAPGAASARRTGRTLPDAALRWTPLSRAAWVELSGRSVMVVWLGLAGHGGADE